jgi:hypothetical protein
MDSRDMQNANEFQLLARAAIGPLRLEIVGSGPVSEYEQKLMKELSGGGGTAGQAAKALLTHWRKLASQKVEQYNYTVKGVSQFSPNVSTIFPEFNLGTPTGTEKGELPPGVTKEAIARELAKRKKLGGAK